MHHTRYCVIKIPNKNAGRIRKIDAADDTAFDVGEDVVIGACVVVDGSSGVFVSGGSTGAAESTDLPAADWPVADWPVAGWPAAWTAGGSVGAWATPNIKIY